MDNSLMRKEIRIRTPSRLHLSLLDMNGGIGRVDGGVGIALMEPHFDLSIRRARGVSCDTGEGELKRTVLETAKRVCKLLHLPGAEIRVRSTIPQHVGFGSKTQLYLGLARGILNSWGIYLPVREIARIVGRGGTSGIGVAAFQYGGFIVDGGHSAEKGFLPSHFSQEEAPPVLIRRDFPWWVVCAWPRGRGAFGAVERGVFEKYCPIPATDVEKATRIVLMKLIPAIIEEDLNEFGNAVNMLQRVGFKAIENKLKRGSVGAILEYIQRNSAGGGLSSFGPVCFGLCESRGEARMLEEDIRAEFGTNALVTRGNNTGAVAMEGRQTQNIHGGLGIR